MKSKILKLRIITLCVTFMLMMVGFTLLNTHSVFATTSEVGTPDNPVLISSIDEFEKFRDDVNAGNSYSGKYIKLTADIDLSKVENWVPIGNSTNKFKGNFDGDNHTISNLVVNTPQISYVGLFGYTENGSIKNIILKNAKVAGRLGVGALAGCPYTTKYDNITLTGLVQIDGMAYVGGLLGRNAYANITNITVDVQEQSYVRADSVEDGIAYRTYVGGVVGFMGEGGHKVENVTSNIAVFGSTIDVGGIVGIAHYGNTLKNVKCSGNVVLENAESLADAKEAGGIAGVWHNEAGTQVVLDNCVFTGEIESSYVDEKGQNKTLTTQDFACGGLVGSAYDTSNQNSGTIDVVSGEGTQENPYKIFMLEELLTLERRVNKGQISGKFFAELGADIDLQGSAITIGTKENSFSGTFDGKGHTISNLIVNDTKMDYVGLFGHTTGTIKNVNVYNVSIIGRAYVGAISGCAYTGSVENCKVLGKINVEGNYMVGGITGHGYATINNCQVIGDTASTFSITSTNNIVKATYLENDLEGDNVGGVVGHHAENMSLSGCKVENITIEGTRKIGGIVGTTFQSNKISDCSVNNIVLKTNATKDYATSKSNSMGIGGIVGLTSDDTYKGGYISGATVQSVEFVFPSELDGLVSAGALIGGHRGAKNVVLPENMDTENNQVDVNTVLGANNTFLSPEFAISTDGFWIINGVKTNHKAVPNAISNIEKWITIGNTTTYRIHFTDGTYFDFTVTDGVDGEQGDKGNAGRGIERVEINGEGKLVVYYTDNSTEILGVVVGSDGINGVSGKDGVDGKDGKDGKNARDTFAILGAVAGCLSLVGYAGLVVYMFKKKR